MPAEVERSLREHGAGWMLEGLPSVGEMTPGRIAPASVQWTEGDVARRIGDAALARDALSSQGLANGISEALYAAAVKNEYEEQLLSLRQREQKAAHLRSLAGLIDSCRFRAVGAWKEYAEFIAGHLVHEQPVPSVALRAGRLQTAPAGGR